ncbi:DUF5391 family protein [Virgibacillus chiguensis]|uniref:DUF5391 family protein n=1 Tax=Virgibacillus chiguensis TaxID=411959 RepID=A0A1M5RED0_9BACI|nr:DUF5391 family protein [Virgibacillus chiguensis]SHH24436.1 hypothetical protein SAMN05421807_105120 [Virgibacillus chiguensis]
MKNKKYIIALTVLSAFLFSALIIAGSLSPLSEMGDNANQFNSVGMWLSIAMILFFYLIPVILYAIGLNWIKIIMAIFCVIGIVILLSTIVIVLIIGLVNHNMLQLSSVLIVSILGVIINIVWLIVAFWKNRGKASGLSS